MKNKKLPKNILFVILISLVSSISAFSTQANASFTASTDSSVANDLATLGLVGSTVTDDGSGAIVTAAISAGHIDITSVSAGSAVVTVTDSGHNATIAVTVDADGAITVGVITPYFTASTDSSVANDLATLGLVGSTVTDDGSGAIVTAAISAGHIDITSVSAGSAVVTVTDSGNSATIAVTVNSIGAITVGSITPYSAPAPAPAPAPVYIPTTPQAALTLSSSATTVEWGTQAKLTLAGGSGTGAVTYSSTGTTFCAVDRNGYLTPVSAGTCTVTANKDGDGTYGSAQSNAIVITATNTPVAASASGSNSGSTLTVGKPVKGVSTVKFKVADTHAGKKVSVIQAVKSSSGKTVYTKLGTAVIDVKGAISFKTKAKLPVGAVLQLKHTSGEVIFSQSIK